MKISNLRKVSTVLLVMTVFFVFSFVALPVNAQEDANILNLNVASKAVQLKVEPGESGETQLRIQNNGVNSEDLKVETYKFEVSRDSVGSRLLKPGPEDEFINWVTLSEDRFLLEPGEKKAITASFNIPEDAAFGYYYAFLFSRDNDEISLDDYESAVLSKSGVLVLLEVNNPNAKRDLAVLEFRADRKWYEFLPTHFTAKLENKGNVHVIPKGNIFIDKGDRTDVGIININEENGNILPDSEREYEASWTDGFPTWVPKKENGKVVMDEDGNPEMKLEWDFAKIKSFRMGKYDAKLLMVFDNGYEDVPVEAETSFWVIPWRIIIVVTILVLLILRGSYNSIKDVVSKVRKRS